MQPLLGYTDYEVVIASTAAQGKVLDAVAT